eukprot:CAMPEP_0179955472 /NCGR_PEP_ID=MMETSP0983-20121128/26190_1 /TAXON_ID=483367 /ORGANISM="non described non described, Strain CCMP 2436" /LENGTH=62 /DNA_ID=CAMNT_0021866887 /DNA_START=53 /DNA_END=241 /DNA_ORIENTATION=-
MAASSHAEPTPGGSSRRARPIACDMASRRQRNQASFSSSFLSESTGQPHVSTFASASNDEAS